MKHVNKKVLGEERRQLILQSLQNASEPLTGSELATKTNVSRQVIVQDISILKARNYPILATAQGYVFMQQQLASQYITKVIACKHTPKETEHELTIIVDHGGIIKDVIVEHPVYGYLTGSLMIRTRRDIREFIKKTNTTNATLLSELTNGVHLHTIQARTEQELTEITEALDNAGYLLTE